MKVSFPSWLTGLIVLLLAPFFFLGGPDSYSPQFVKTVWNFGHVAFFAILFLFVQSFKPLSHWRHWIIATLGILVLGGIIETVQHFVGRNASWDDLLHNLFGVWLGLFWGQKPTRQVWVLRIVSVIFIVPAAWLVVDAAWADVVMRKQFPLISSFETRAELHQVRANTSKTLVQQTDVMAKSGRHSLVVDLDTKKFAGVRLVGPYGDWSGYQFLVMDFYNPDNEPLELVLKISDYQHDSGSNEHRDRFNRAIMLMAGWNEIRIDLEEIRSAPAGRSMQLNRVTGFAVFAVKLPEPRKFYVDNIRLE